MVVLTRDDRRDELMPSHIVYRNEIICYLSLDISCEGQFAISCVRGLFDGTFAPLRAGCTQAMSAGLDPSVHVFTSDPAKG